MMAIDVRLKALDLRNEFQTGIISDYVDAAVQLLLVEKVEELIDVLKDMPQCSQCLCDKIKEE